MKKIDAMEILEPGKIMKIGNAIQLSGAVLSGEGKNYVIPIPNGMDMSDDFIFVDTDLIDWEKIIRQMDLLETEILAKSSDGAICKVIMRKSTRIVEQGISWTVFKRDSYSCRYCGKSGIPLTVDHLVLWEKGGPTIEQNLVSACRKCNRTRDNMEFADWLVSDAYRKVSQNLPLSVRRQNEDLVEFIKTIPVRIHQRSR